MCEDGGIEDDGCGSPCSYLYAVERRDGVVWASACVCMCMHVCHATGSMVGGAGVGSPQMGSASYGLGRRTSCVSCA